MSRLEFRNGFGWPMVYEIHSLLGDEVARDSLGRGLVFNVYRAIEKRVLGRAAAVITRISSA